MKPKLILVLPHIKVNNANAWSSPYTSGFPSLCAFGGAVNALQRKLNQFGLEKLELKSFAVISHKFSLNAYREGKYVNFSLITSANPLDKDGKRPSFVPEIKCRMEISLLCELDNYLNYENEFIEQQVLNTLKGNFRIASGDVLSVGKIFVVPVGTEDNDRDFIRYIVRSLMPGYALIERRELMEESMKNGTDALDAMLEHISVLAKPCHSGEIERGRKENGWIVPISTGYHAISNLGTAINQRDKTVPHRFAESLITLGEFKTVHRVQNINALLWNVNYDEKNGIYCYRQNSQNTEDELFNFDSFMSNY